MKLLLTLLLCFFGSALSNQCFMNGLWGYTTTYQTVAVGLNTFQNGVITPQTFTDSGQIVVNYRDKTMYNSIYFTNDAGSTYMQIFTFGQNQTQYILLDSKCYRQPAGPFPSYLPMVPVANPNNYTVGDTQVELWQLVDPNTDYYSQKIMAVNARTCAFMTTTTRNTNSNGMSNSVFSNFQTGLYTVPLPYQCYNSYLVEEGKFSDIKAGLGLYL
ncbi:hypothetical protein DICPUDRAFT_83625 [Dictyostelium purpureum]|uniref:Uncharacterized protein n=1 Tax=Dictyostelium purpureum TaxID=5786 RepID=F1A040_DICPU|nr:uncharacterized protein DICPUDRAFT_83625 [Dictyostelium purpureum]EGC30438.1 hypothetical protein DICPUDRAFT_83625 [Dictyostelium purpureum]|eukprot:XP_003293038.1 hypothetical protein DICPUDRAFT_83625 [Dictyostelium purpureum]